MVISPNRCLTDGQVVTVSAPAGAIATSAELSAQASAFIVQCNQDPAIPNDGSGCNLASLALGTIGADGSIAATPLTVKTGQVGTSAMSVCPPTQSQADAGTVTCTIVASPGGAAGSIVAGITIEGQSVVLPVDASGNPTTPSTGSSSGTATGATSVAGTEATRALAFTGVHGMTWWLVAIGAALLDLGYLLLSSTWTSKATRRVRIGG
jgi:hypothetical protein